jgi:hypothetical protein
LRFYCITISDPNSGQVFQTSATGLGFTKGSGGFTFASTSTGTVSGQNLPGALNVEFDIPVVPMHTPQGQAYIRVWGIGLPMIGQASQLAGMSIVLSAGMQKGLPLANPAQAGVLIEGEIFQAFGNWQGINQTLDLIVQPSGLQPNTGVSFNWPANTPLKSALQTTLTAAFPGYKPNFADLTANLTQAAPEAGTYPSLTTFAQYLQQRTQPMGASSTGNKNYPGVSIVVQSASKTLYVFDNPKKLVTLNFQDLIGQPTWINPGTINFKTVMRSDIAVGNKIKFPLGVQAPFALTTAAAAPGLQASSKTAFQGVFEVNDIHYFANFRQPDAESWNTSFTAFLSSLDG